MRTNFKALFQALALATMLTFLTIMGIIESFRYGFVIALSIPLALIGVALFLFMDGGTVNIFSLMGVIMVTGMVVNNSIIFMDYTLRHLNDGGTDPVEMVMASGRERFRVILMANTTTVVAMIPLSLGYGFGGEIFRPMALVEIGGVLSAGVLSLVVIPVLCFGMLKRDARRAAAAGSG